MLKVVCVALLMGLLFTNSAMAKDMPEKWELAGELGEGYAALYIDKNSISVNKEDKTVTFIGKRELTAKGIKERRRDFEEGVEKAEKETGEKVEDKDTLFEKVILPMSVYFNKYTINCKTKELARIPAEGAITLVIVDKIKEGTTEHRLMERFCKGLNE